MLNCSKQTGQFKLPEISQKPNLIKTFKAVYIILWVNE